MGENIKYNRIFIKYLYGIVIYLLKPFWLMEKFKNDTRRDICNLIEAKYRENK